MLKFKFFQILRLCQSPGCAVLIFVKSAQALRKPKWNKRFKYLRECVEFQNNLVFHSLA